MLPNFLIIGAPKCATTWLADCLREHPEIFLPVDKELRFFCGTQLDRTLSWYSGQFRGAAGHPAIGEASPSYLGSEAAPARIAEALPGVKLVVCVRNPVDQAHSFYWHLVSRGMLPVETGFHRFMAEQRPRAGYYAQHLDRYLEHFPREDILVLLYEEEVRANPAKGFERCLRFLGVDPEFVPSMLSTPRNAQRQVTGFHDALQRARRALGVLPPRITRPVKQAGKALLRLLPVRHERQPLSQADRRALLSEYYLQDIQRLEGILDRDLSIWNGA